MKKDNTLELLENSKRLERQQILSKADEIKGEQLILLPDGVKTEKELKSFALGSIDNPDRKYELYYSGIMRLLRKNLPKGPSNRKAREFIYEEKNALLTRGKRKGKSGIRFGDSRMAYLSDVEELLDIIISWVVSNGTMVQLFNTLRDLNISKGYGASKNF
jgi:hypothetical protein